MRKAIRRALESGGAVALLAAACLVAPARAVDAQPTATPVPGATAGDGSPILEAAGIERSWFDIERLPFIPVPEVETSPHSGVNLGLLPVFLGNNEQGQIHEIIAPDIIHSQYFGWGARFRIFRNLSEDEKWSFVAGAKQYVEREMDAQYDVGLQRDRPWTFSAHAMYDRSGTGRFYGLGNATPATAETSFINDQIRLEFLAARNFSRAVQLGFLVRADSVEVEQSALSGLPATIARYPGIVGVGDASELHQRLVFTYDTRDSVVMPREGEHLSAAAGFTTRALGSSVAYTVLALEGTVYRPFGRGAVLVAHAAARYMPTYGDAPFWALSSIGGDRSVVAEMQPLRGYGAGRFVDRNSFSANVETRFDVKTFHVFSSDITLEAAPFIDSGKVFSSMSGSPWASPNAAAGLGLRLRASPFIVGYLDLGIGREKLAAFTGIDYPF